MDRAADVSPQSRYRCQSRKKHFLAGYTLNPRKMRKGTNGRVAVLYTVERGGAWPSRSVAGAHYPEWVGGNRLIAKLVATDPWCGTHWNFSGRSSKHHGPRLDYKPILDRRMLLLAIYPRRNELQYQLTRNVDDRIAGASALLGAVDPSVLHVTNPWLPMTSYERDRMMRWGIRRPTNSEKGSIFDTIVLTKGARR